MVVDLEAAQVRGGTERLTLPDGGWWEIKTVITRGMRKQINQASLKALGNNAGAFMDGAKERILEHPEALDLNAIDDAMLLVGSVAYSYGPTIDIATIDNLPEAVTQPVLDRLHQLYAGMSKEQAAGFFERR